MSAYPYLYDRRPRRTWQPPALHRTTTHRRYRARRPVGGVEAHEHWTGRAMSRWFAAHGVGRDATWLRLGARARQGSARGAGCAAVGSGGA